MRKKESRTFFSAFVIALAVIATTALAIYIFFLKPSYIDCGIPVETKENKTTIRLKLDTGSSTSWITIPKEKYSPDVIAYNVFLKGKRVKSISPSGVFTGKVMGVYDKSIDLDTASIPFSEDISFLKLEDKELTKLSKNSVLVGSTGCKVLIDRLGYAGSVIVDTEFSGNIRVGVSDSNFSSLNHKSLMFLPVYESKLQNFYSYAEDKLTLRNYAASGLRVISDKIDYTLEKGEFLCAQSVDGSIELSVYSLSTKNDIALKKVIGKTKARVYVMPTSKDPVYIRSLTRSSGYKPVYYGNFEITLRDGSLRLINEVNIEKYLRYVVPSEMLPSGGEEAYKVQAIAARTYVLSDMISGRYAALGCHVDDTTYTQMYNAQPSLPDSDKAIEETAGKVLTYNDVIIDAKYYSTSCGTGAPFNEVYYSGSSPSKVNPKPYLTFENYTDEKLPDLSQEHIAVDFFKDWTIKAYDSNSPYFRWKYSLEASDLTEIVNDNIYSLYLKDPAHFLKKTYLNMYKKTTIPQQGIGKVKDIEITKRGEGGNVLELAITAETGDYLVKGSSNIRKLLTPKDLTITPLYGKEIKMMAMPSSFFILDKQKSGSRLRSITVYGGGYGHGVGMSQYGVIGLVRENKTYDEILKIFYNDTVLQDMAPALKTSIK